VVLPANLPTVDVLAEMKTVWSDLLDEIDFLDRLYDLDAPPSHDPRFGIAGHDIAQHRILNLLDWDDDGSSTTAGSRRLRDRPGRRHQRCPGLR